MASFAPATANNNPLADAFSAYHTKASAMNTGAGRDMSPRVRLPSAVTPIDSINPDLLTDKIPTSTSSYAPVGTQESRGNASSVINAAIKLPKPMDITPRGADWSALEKINSPELLLMFKKTAETYGVSDVYLRKLAYIESRGNIHADNGIAQGLMQFIPGTAKTYGVNPFDPASSIEGAAKYTIDNSKAIKAALGRDPQDAELYIAHQQGGEGAAKLFSNPDTPAGRLVGRKAIENNGGDPDAPAKDFVAMWKRIYMFTPAQNPLPDTAVVPGANQASDIERDRQEGAAQISKWEQ